MYTNIWLHVNFFPTFVFDIAENNTEKPYIATVWSAVYLLRYVFLLYRLVCKSRFNASTVFQSCIIYTRRDHLCFSRKSRKLNNFLVIPFNLCVRAVSFYLSFCFPFIISPSPSLPLSLFHVLSIFPLSLMLGAIILVMCMLQRA